MARRLLRASFLKKLISKNAALRAAEKILYKSSLKIIFYCKSGIRGLRPRTPLLDNIPNQATPKKTPNPPTCSDFFKPKMTPIQI
jgi:hypothetical protein